MPLMIVMVRMPGLTRCLADRLEAAATSPARSRLCGSADGAQDDCDDVSGLDAFDAADRFLDG
jgi:hypothetical protein